MHEAQDELRIYCIRCGQLVEEIHIERDPILLRPERVLVKCHGDQEMFSWRQIQLLNLEEIWAFGGH